MATTDFAKTLGELADRICDARAFGAMMSPDTDVTPTSVGLTVVEPDRLSLTRLRRIVQLANAVGCKTTVGNVERNVVVRLHAPTDALLLDAQEKILTIERNRAMWEARDVAVRAADNSALPPDAGLNTIMMRLRKSFPTDRNTDITNALVDAVDESILNVRVTMVPGSVLPAASLQSLTQLAAVEDMEIDTTRVEGKHVLMLLVRLKRRKAKRLAGEANLSVT